MTSNIKDIIFLILQRAEKAECLLGIIVFITLHIYASKMVSHIIPNMYGVKLV